MWLDLSFLATSLTIDRLGGEQRKANWEATHYDGMRDHRDARKNPHREEGYTLTATKRPGPPLRGGLETARRSHMLMVARWLPTIYMDSRISSDIRKKTLTRIKLPRTMECRVRTVLGMRLLVGEILNLCGWWCRIQARRHARPVSEVLRFPSSPPIAS